MKQFLLKSRLLVAALVLGGMFLVSNSAMAQTSNTLVAPPANNKSWVNIPTAQQTVQSEIAALTQEMNLKLQQGAPDQELKLLKFKLQFMMYMEQGLNSGLQVYDALSLAKSMIIGSEATDNNTAKAAKAQKLYDEFYVKFTV